MDKTSIRKIIDNHIRSLEGSEFQDFGDRLGLKLYPGDYTPVRAAGPKGDMKNDGYCPKARVFFAAHATRGEKIASTKAKIKSDLEGCLEQHTDVVKWVYLTNDTLPGEVETYIDEELRPVHKHVAIEVWGYKPLGEMLVEMPAADIERILGINLVPPERPRSDIPVVTALGPLGRSGGTAGHKEIFVLKNLGSTPAIDVRLMIVGDDYSWASDLRRTLSPGESIKNLEYPMGDHKPHNEVVNNLRALIEYEDASGNTVTAYHDLEQETVPSGMFKILKLGRFHPPVTTVDYQPTEVRSHSTPAATVTPPASAPIPTTLAGFEQLLDTSEWVKESIDYDEVWMAKDNALFQIRISGETEEFTEPWTQVHPDSLGSGKLHVNLTISGIPIKQFIFVYCDGGRIRVPLPEIKIVNEERQFYWESGSLKYKLGRLIGNFYIYRTLEGVAARSGIEVI